MFVLREPLPDNPEELAYALVRRLTADLEKHAMAVHENTKAYDWTTNGETLLLAVWACSHGQGGQMIITPAGDAIPARTLVANYGLHRLCERRGNAAFN